MVSSLQELERIKAEYYQWYSGNNRDSQKRASAVASDNFSWVLETAIGLHERNKTTL